MKTIDIANIEKPLDIPDYLNRLLSAYNIRRTAARIGRTLQSRMVQEVPENISACIFDCTRNDCDANCRTQCTLRNHAMLRGNGLNRHKQR